MIEVKGLYKSFEGKTVLHNIDATFENGKTSLIIGQSVYKEPVSGLQTFAQVLMEKCGATEEQLRVMMIENPAKLMDIRL